MTTRHAESPSWAYVVALCAIGYPIIFAVAYLFIVALAEGK
jgi:hypothetical protein